MACWPQGPSQQDQDRSEGFSLVRKPWRWKLLTVNPTVPLCLASPLTVIVLIFSCVITGLVAADNPCSSLCDCKWKGGKETATCVNAKFIEIPKGLDPGTQVLNLTANKLTNIGKDAFFEASLINLQKIYLGKCSIKTIDRFAFRNLINLVELDLSYNFLSAVPSHIFESIPELSVLKLSGNPIQRIVNDAFKRVPLLERLELSECHLGTVEARAFAGLEDKLEWLKLDKNKLIEVKSSTLTTMQNLKGLELAENPWNCTCELRPLREWMLRQNIPCDVPPVCRHPPRLAGKPWDKLDLDEFACMPKITAPKILTTGVEGKNVTMSCKVGGVPEPRVKWMLKNKVIANLSGVPYSNGRKMYMVHVTDYASNLTISTADMQDAGVYVCTAENKAGKVEARVTLAVLRRPPDSGLSGRVLIASIIVAALFVLASCLIVLCICSVRRRQGVGGSRWQGQAQSGITRAGRRRDDSYEKIEMNHKGPTMLNHAATGNGRGVLPKGGSNLLPTGQNAEVAIVGPIMKQRTRHGEYRGVPSVDTDLGEDDADDDEEGGYEDEVETPTPTTVVSSTRDGKTSWSGPRSSDDTPSSHRTSDASEVRSSVLSDSADLHIPRVAGGYLENRDDRLLGSDDITSLGRGEFPRQADTHNARNQQQQDRYAAISNMLRRELGDMTSPPLLQQHIMRKQTIGNNGGSLYTSVPLDSEGGGVDGVGVSVDGVDSRTGTDKNYPDLLEISPYNLSGVGASGGLSNITDSFCTLPRRRGGAFERGSTGRGSARYYRGSDSQSPLLPDSRYGSSGGEGSGGSNGSIPRRSSIDSYSSSYYPLSATLGGKKHTSIGQQRSSSSMNLASPAVSSISMESSIAGTTILSGRTRKNPSLPTSPVLERPPVSTPVSATPLLNLMGSNSLGGAARPGDLYPTSPNATTGPSTAANTYDYHAAQLERFLEEYRSLQEQLCKMKETCENIRQQEPPGRSATTPTPSISRFVDPLLYSGGVTTPSGSDDSTNPKSILKNKTSTVAVTAASASSPMGVSAASPIGLGTSGGAVDYGSDLPPYWLPRNTLLRRFSGGEFYQS
ncbi:hypothetical protein C0J52_17471 [Blattella germanica]|nr:hypothetical protein C0J52_17471 [Blattella germanica]